jgi:hypothetical protein
MQALMHGIMQPQDGGQQGSIPPAYPSVPPPPMTGPPPPMFTGPPPPMSSAAVGVVDQSGRGPSPTNSPFWMDVPQQTPQQRTGVAKDKGSSGLQTFGFFALIIFFVATAGIIGVVVWGPEKHSSKSQSHLATDPPPSASLPSLPADPPPAASAAPTENPAPADSSKKAGAKKGVGGGKWRKH